MLTSSPSDAQSALPFWAKLPASVIEDAERIAVILDKLDAEQGNAGSDRRREPRRVWRHGRVLVEIDADSDEKYSYLAVTRNLSMGGMSFLNAYSLPPRSEVRVVPATVLGKRWPVKAQVVRWRAIEPRVFEIALRFVGPRRGQILTNLPDERKQAPAAAPAVAAPPRPATRPPMPLR